MKITKRPSIAYLLLWYYARLIFCFNYRRITYLGREKIPKQGAVIFVANHQSALMDALAILFMRKHYPLFVARADIFKQATIRKVLHFLRILPINRIRDGYESVLKNDDTTQQVIETLSQQIPFVILPEGTHHASKTLSPLLKGVFRMAQQTYQHTQGSLPIYIVPIGIELSGYYRWGEELLVQVGDPIDITNQLDQMVDLSFAEQINSFKEQLVIALKRVMIHVTPSPYYDAILLLSEKGVSGLPKQRFDKVKSNVEKYERLLVSDPPKGETLLFPIQTFIDDCHKRGIDDNSLRCKNLSKSLFFIILFLIISFPFLILNSPIWAISALIGSKMKDRVFDNSIRMLVTLVLPLIVYPIYIAIAIQIGLVSIYLWLFIILLLPSWIISGYTIRYFELLISHIKYINIHHKKR